MSAISNEISTGLKPLRVTPPMTGVEWADKYFYLPEGSSHIAGRWNTQPVQIAMLNMMTNDAIKIVSVRKSARLGYTKILVAALLYTTEHKKRSSVVYQPIDDESDGFVSDEIDPVIVQMPVIQSIFPDWDSSNERNNINRKQMAGAIIDFRGASSPGNFRRLTKQSVYGDEVDGWPMEVAKNGKGEGSPIELALVRIKGAAYPKAVFGSTPTITGKSHIEMLEGSADLVFRFYLPCPHCGFDQPLVFGFEDVEYGLKWDDSQPTREKKGRSAYYQCCNCPEHFNYNDLEKMELAGRWMAEDCTWTKDGINFFDHDGAAVRAPKHAALVVSALYSLNLDGWSEIVDAWLKAKGDPLKEKAFYNTVLGELWDEVASEQLEHDLLLQRAEKYPAEVPDRVVYLSGGIDSQTSGRYECYVWGWGEEEETWLINKTIVFGRYDAEETLQRVDEVIRRQYTRKDGTKMSVGRWCWDTGGIDPDIVYQRSLKLGVLWVIPIKGASTYGGPIADMPRTKNKQKVFLTMIGTDTAKDLVYNRLQLQPEQDRPVPGAIHFPDDVEIFGETEAKQLVSEVLIPKLINGKVVYRWDNQKRRNEALDCFIYALAALRLTISRFQLNLKALAEAMKGNVEKKGKSLAEMAKQLGSGDG
ncbi:phage terminase large subunit family protein [Citrobacter sp. S2-9]|uniref:Phage terminase large subunit family protein n=1 Tax=Citrobacter enshiensis TaxID=2971264 RepID=A0ABT8PRQ4_9ENTR|nr:terminase gpA endonuclease subunit [Citrobacter enshiensis]MDN8599026.1 phage terminase large subunit family protein [Citrobacter enshiensis]